MKRYSLSSTLLSFGVILFSSIDVNAQDSSSVIPLWKNGAPGFENRKNEPEQAKDWWVRNIHNPSITVYLPSKAIATGTAVVICPGGGFVNNVYTAEGKDAANYFNSLGVAAFVLKYRLFRAENSGYTKEHPTQDIFRAMRLVRSRAKEFNIDTARLGVMGFSAGGELAAWVSYNSNKNNSIPIEVIDKLNARPSFQILIYPGPLAVPETIPSNAPPTFLLAANGDECCSEPIIKLTQMHRKANVPVEMHLYAKGAHAFNMGYRTEFTSLKAWPQRMADWLKDNGWIKK
ncbi:MAG TPA: alpha/beta hydrolase [Cyclobacteriaceae bacterium]|jgi:acetyl esterase/lipase|nr:alpha/beta hydrolase [Cyclobacteriaceae bacterium]